MANNIIRLFDPWENDTPICSLPKAEFESAIAALIETSPFDKETTDKLIAMWRTQKQELNELIESYEKINRRK